MSQGATATLIGVIIKNPADPLCLSESQKQALHQVLHVFPGSVLCLRDGQEVPLRTVPRSGCEGCADEQQRLPE